VQDLLNLSWCSIARARRLKLSWMNCFYRRPLLKSLNGLSYSTVGSQGVASHVSNPVEGAGPRQCIDCVKQKYFPIKPTTMMFLAGILVLCVWILLARCVRHKEISVQNFFIRSELGCVLTVSWYVSGCFLLFNGSEESIYSSLQNPFMKGLCSFK